jgi:bacteriocin-like protein
MAKTTKSPKKGKPTSSPDKLLKTGKDGKIELTEDELNKVAGGYGGIVIKS